MKHPQTTIAICALLVAGCASKPEQPKSKASTMTCNTLHDRNSKCAAQMAKVITDKMTTNFPAETKKKLGDRIAQSIVKGNFVTKCRTQWASTEPRDKKVKAALQKCLAIKDCEPYAKCFLDAMDQGRSKKVAPKKVAPKKVAPPK